MYRQYVEVCTYPISCDVGRLRLHMENCRILACASYEYRVHILVQDNENVSSGLDLYNPSSLVANAQTTL